MLTNEPLIKAQNILTGLNSSWQALAKITLQYDMKKKNTKATIALIIQPS